VKPYNFNAYKTHGGVNITEYFMVYLEHLTCINEVTILSIHGVNFLASIVQTTEHLLLNFCHTCCLCNGFLSLYITHTLLCFFELSKLKTSLAWSDHFLCRVLLLAVST